MAASVNAGTPDTPVGIGAEDAVATKRRIIICGYPKSGTTWLGRLVAELVDCPFQGDLGFAHSGAREGQERDSAFICYKTHHTWESLVRHHLHDHVTLIYIVRDPRDVAISAAHHFQVNPLERRLGDNKMARALGARLARVVPHALKRRRLIDAVLGGDSSLSAWLAVPWREHYRGFHQSGTPILRYEDLLDDPLKKCAEILAWVGVARPEARILSAISNQSFETRKGLAEARGSVSEYRYLRRGSQGYWRAELTERQRRRFIEEVGEELRELSYRLH